MGYQGRVDWTDMSDYVVHFTKPVTQEQVADIVEIARRRRPGVRMVARVSAHAGRTTAPVRSDRTGHEEAAVTSQAPDPGSC